MCLLRYRSRSDCHPPQDVSHRHTDLPWPDRHPSSNQMPVQRFGLPKQRDQIAHLPSHQIGLRWQVLNLI
ncbi:Uncharacterised protein [Vibrio cholerae]|nr:Uncharacterised protein [Vibrio cholerae]